MIWITNNTNKVHNKCNALHSFQNHSPTPVHEKIVFCKTGLWYQKRLLECLITQSCLTLLDPMDCSLPGSSVHGILQARILEWVAIPISRRTPNPGIEPGSPALQADSLPFEPLGKPPFMCELKLLFRIAKLLDLKLSGLHRPRNV